MNLAYAVITFVFFSSFHKYSFILIDYEINLLHLLEKLANGSKVDINATGTTLYYAPGALIGGIVEHECSLQRGIGYYLELVLYIAPFMKTSLELRLKGVTNDRDDPSVSIVFILYDNTCFYLDRSN